MEESLDEERIEESLAEALDLRLEEVGLPVVEETEEEELDDELEEEEDWSLYRQEQTYQTRTRTRQEYAYP
jgi:hypothetical protein